jgi:signal transduction histidine kinase/ligand-binding sensor domain-containing protein
MTHDRQLEGRWPRRTVERSQLEMTSVVVDGGRRRTITCIERCALVLVVMATVCIEAFALDRDRSIGQFYYTFWSEKDGAPSEVSALAQTQDGYLWIGSERGLFRFDGVNFDEYSPPPGVNLPSHSIYSLMSTPDGGLWIAFEPNGLGFYKDGSLTVFTRPEQLPDSPVHCFARDSDGRIWAGTETGLVFRQGDRWISVGQEWNFAPEMIRYIYVDREGTLWVATDKRVLYLKRGSKRFEFGGPVSGAVTTLAQAPNGRVWLADDGINVARPVPTEERDSMVTGPSIAADGLRELLFDRDGALWITRLDSGIVRIRNPEKLEARKYGPQDRELESFGSKDGFPAGSAYKILEDHEGNIWVGCSNGLVRIRHNQVVPVALPQRYERLTLLTGRQGELWVGTISDKPLLKIRGESMTAEAGGNTVSSVLRDINGDVWWGSRTGIWRQRGSAFTYFRLPKDAEPGRMWDLMPSSDNHGFWVKLDDDGLVRFDNGTWNLHDWPRGVPSVGGTFKYGPSASYRDPSGRFWLGYTSGQIFLVDRDHPTEFSKKDGVDLGRIKVIRGQTDHVWAGGELGLEFFGNGRFWKVQPASGEPFGAVSGIIETSDMGLWLNEMKGIVQIPSEEIREVLADPSHRVSCRRFDYLDGLPGTPQMSYTNSTAARTSDGRLWFATDSGLAWIDPAHLTKNLIPPPVSILSIASENGRKTISGPIKFGAGTHTIEIHYAGLSLSIPERVQFRYKLDGIDADWQNVGTRRQAYYNNLGPGTYRFRVIACNNDGVWNTSGTFLDFYIAPAYYQTSWFLWICALALAGLLWALYQLRLHQIHRQFAVGLEERLGERTRIARELHDTLLQSFQGALFQIQAARNMLLRKADNAMTVLDEAILAAEEGITEGRAAIQDLRPDPVGQRSLPELLKATGHELAGNEELNGHSPAFQVIVEGREQNLSLTLQEEIYKISREAIRNAFLHAAASHIEVEIQYDEDQLRLRIRDDGKGINPEILKSGAQSGHWGIRGIRERAQKIGARLEFWSEVGAGTELELTVPAAVAYEEHLNRRRFWLFH